jgi:hypothetical protein
LIFFKTKVLIFEEYFSKDKSSCKSSILTSFCSKTCGCSSTLFSLFSLFSNSFNKFSSFKYLSEALIKNNSITNINIDDKGIKNENMEIIYNILILFF